VLRSEEPDLSPVLERLSAAEARLSVLGDLRDRVVTVETKAAQPVATLEAQTVDLSPVCERLATLETKIGVVLPSFDVSIEALEKDFGTLRERLAVVEVRPSLPGPPGDPGPPGKDGIDGKDGTAGLSFEGVYQEGKSYDKGHLVTWAGSSWHANEPTTTKPGDGSKAWTLMTKRGRDGKDGMPGADGKPGRDLTEKAAWRS
jgi:hypothetical protein